jgi:hypothetical protein
VPGSTPTGTLNINLTGSNGKLSHSVQVFLVVAPHRPEASRLQQTRLI